ncbi:hypothetical protein [Burkholderia cenocepacia]|uniref:hypothetical protein n=1 Tax=Burkholderia cenocepacia TaxID=95486 RepID=UPI002ABE5D4E|nr:hypothetical protein [Burkholderia cenocepacia]
MSKRTIKGTIEECIKNLVNVNASYLSKTLHLSRHRIVKYCKANNIDLDYINDKINAERAKTTSDDYVEDLDEIRKKIGNHSFSLEQLGFIKTRNIKSVDNKAMALEEVKNQITKYGFTLNDLSRELEQGKQRKRKARSISLPEPTNNKIKLDPPSQVKIKLTDEDD